MAITSIHTLGTVFAFAFLSFGAVNGEEIGYYSWNWGSGSTGPSKSNFGIAFTGLIDIGQAIKDYDENASWCCPPLKGKKMITLGGGNGAGVFTETSVKAIKHDMYLIPEAGYAGVVFDVEIVRGSAQEMIPIFQQAFVEAKKWKLEVVVTVSHSAPYECDSPKDAVDFIKAWVSDDNIDMISPQLYSSGSETKPDFDETFFCKDAGCKWSLYERSKAKFVPSIVAEDQYKAVQAFFVNNIRVDGFIQWAQTTSKIEEQ